MIEPPEQLLASSAPLTGQWTTTLATAEYIRDVACPSTSLCVAVSDQNTILTSSDPASGTWSTDTVSGIGDIDSVSCSTTTFCAAAGASDGDVLVSTNPARGATAWTPVLADRIDCASTPGACGAEQIIASDRTGVHTLDSSTEFEEQTGPQLTGLALTDNTLTWNDHGSPTSAQLTP